MNITDAKTSNGQVPQGARPAPNPYAKVGERYRRAALSILGNGYFVRHVRIWAWDLGNKLARELGKQMVRDKSLPQDIRDAVLAAREATYVEDDPADLEVRHMLLETAILAMREIINDHHEFIANLTDRTK